MKCNFHHERRISTLFVNYPLVPSGGTVDLYANDYFEYRTGSIVTIWVRDGRVYDGFCTPENYLWGYKPLRLSYTAGGFQYPTSKHPPYDPTTFCLFLGEGEISMIGITMHVNGVAKWAWDNKPMRLSGGDGTVWVSGDIWCQLGIICIGYDVRYGVVGSYAWSPMIGSQLRVAYRLSFRRVPIPSQQRVGLLPDMYV